MNTNLRKRSSRAVLFTTLALAVVISSILLARSTVFHKKTQPVGGNSYTKGEPGSPSTDKSSDPNSQSGTASSDSSQPGDQKSETGGTTTSTTLLVPSGDFLSNHHPNLDGSPAPNTISSVCNTTPGATCSISFTKDGVTKSLAVMTTDRGGSAFWNWKLQDIGLTTGTWTVKATSSLNGQSKTSTDALDLVVEP